MADSDYPIGYPLRTPHPLDAACLRHERSRECLENVEGLITELASFYDTGDGRGSCALAYQDADSGEWIPMDSGERVPLGIVFGVSEMLYNLKVSLDYVMYALFKQALAAGRISRGEAKGVEKGVQFPIMDTPKKLLAWRYRHWQWLRAEERALIRGAQPYRRPLMHLLGDLYHNLDKHRDLQRIILEIDISNAVIRPIEGLRYGDAFQTEPAAKRPVAVYVRGAVQVVLPDGAPVVETLQVLESEVAALIDAFNLAFEP